MANLRKANIPESPGVYAVYRDGERMYVGKANCLRNRVWKDHWGLGKCLTGSALRRNVAEHLDIASSADIKARRYQLTAEEVAAVRLWLDGCDIAWIKRNTEVAAERLESDLKAEYKPPLTRQSAARDGGAAKPQGRLSRVACLSQRMSLVSQP
jgi:hypothetical protein